MTVDCLVLTKNRPSLFNRCVKSISAQTKEEKEIFIADNNDVVTYTNTHKNVIHSPDLYSSYEVLLNNTKAGCFIIVEDDDVLINTGALEFCTNILEEYNTDCVVFKCSEKMQEIVKKQDNTLELFDSASFLDNFNLIFNGEGENGTFQFGQVLFRNNRAAVKKGIEKISLNKTCMQNDEIFFKEFVKNTKTVLLYNTILLFIGTQGDNLTWKK